MKIGVKYLILTTGFISAFASFNSDLHTAGPGITAAGAFLAFALLEIYDLRIDNNTKEED